MKKCLTCNQEIELIFDEYWHSEETTDNHSVATHQAGIPDFALKEMWPNDFVL